MMGLIAPTEGEVWVDGRPLAAAGLGGWRRRLGSVAQDDRLFAGSLAENIAWFDPAIALERVIAAARLAAVHDTIAAMPMGYETLVGDMGSALSGGQKQRVLLARALYPEPAALFVDEGTAHLDLGTERQVLAALAGLPLTRVVSAHRPAALAAAARTIWVSGGDARELVPAEAEADAVAVAAE